MGVTADIGARGENAAAEWLLGNGFSILHRNWRNAHCELDIVAARGDMIHFVEVKTRRRGSLTSPQEAITPAKFRSLAKAAEAYLAQYGVALEPQFDLVSVVYDGDRCEVEYVPHAMSCRW